MSFFIAITCLPLYGQKNNLWISFFNKDSSLVGFKDINGRIRIKPQYAVGFTIAKKFDKIIATEILKNGTMRDCYLLKNLKIIGKDSVYYFDNTPDCESEGFIRFKDYKNDKVGMLDGNGQMVIHAKYNELLPVRNGLIVALEGAEKNTGKAVIMSIIVGKEVINYCSIPRVKYS